ncbi:Splicing factor U2af small subunit B [Nymphaea thermarum]|nr:Splicing factor U2af small subunit B [Nymphaea thermarum]
MVSNGRTEASDLGRVVQRYHEDRKTEGYSSVAGNIFPCHQTAPNGKLERGRKCGKRGKSFFCSTAGEVVLSGCVRSRKEGNAEHLASIFRGEKERVNCPFCFKIGAWRHGDRCSRLYTKPSLSPTLLFSNMYQRPDMINPGVDLQGQAIDLAKSRNILRLTS